MPLQLAPSTVDSPFSRSRGVLAFGLLAGPVAWLALLDLRYVVVPEVCDGGPGWLLHVATAATALMAGGGVGVSLWAYRRTIRTEMRARWLEPPSACGEPSKSATGTLRSETRALVALTGLFLSALFLLLILAPGYPPPLPGYDCGSAPALDRATIVRSADTLLSEPPRAAGGHRDGDLVAGPTLA